MHQKIPQDFEKRGAGREGGDLCWYVRTRLIASLLGCLHQWKGGVEGRGWRWGFEFEKNFKRYRWL